MTAADWPSGLRTREGVSSRVQLWGKPNIVADRELLESASREPFRGVHASGQDGAVGLFEHSARIDTSPLVELARTYLATLPTSEVQAGRFPMDDPSWRQWANPAVNLLRHGLLLEQLDQPTRERALDIVRASLSKSGFDAVEACIKLNRTIGEIRAEVDELNEWLYWFSVYGEPDEAQPWGWQLDGHHVNVNCAVVDGRLVLTPTFLGAEPVAAFDGTFAGTWALQSEQDLGSEFFVSLHTDQQAAATISSELPEDLITGAGRDNFELNYEGLLLSTLSEAQLAKAVELIGVYVGRERKDSAELKMAQVLAHLDETYFGWVGEPNPHGVFYYRVHSPVILIEFEHSKGIMFDNDYHARNHIHTVVRTPNGNDYGKDYLRQHHERHHRTAP